MAFQDLLEIKEIEGVRCHKHTHSHKGIFLLIILYFVVLGTKQGDPGPPGIKGEKGKSTIRNPTLLK